MPVKIEITADTALEVLTIGKELFGLVGVVGEASAPAAPARGRGKKAEAGEPAVVRSPPRKRLRRRRDRRRR